MDEPAPVADADAGADADADADGRSPSIPPTDGREDAATAKLRDAVAAVAALTADVRESAEANRVAAAAAAQAAADAAAQAAAAAAEQAAADAAAQAAAEAAAAQRAAWKQSLQGYANGKIPDSALCGVSFDASVRLRCDAAEQLDVLNTAYQAHFGTDMVISDSYRSYAGPGLLPAHQGLPVRHARDLEPRQRHRDRLRRRHRDVRHQAARLDGRRTRPALQWVHPSWAEPRGSKPEAWHWEYSG